MPPLDYKVFNGRIFVQIKKKISLSKFKVIYLEIPTRCKSIPTRCIQEILGGTNKLLRILIFWVAGVFNPLHTTICKNLTDDTVNVNEPFLVDSKFSPSHVLFCAKGSYQR